MAFKFESLKIPEVVLVTRTLHGDGRGSFDELYRESIFAASGIAEKFVQDNHSRSSMGVLRGMHCQAEPHAQGKLVFVVAGKVLDVAVDMRRSSPTYLSWVSAELDGDSGRALYIPAGFAHGFLALTDNVHFVYKCTAEYDPQSERGFRWDDPDVGISWGNASPIVSARDQALPRARDVELANG